MKKIKFLLSICVSLLFFALILKSTTGEYVKIGISTVIIILALALGVKPSYAEDFKYGKLPSHLLHALFVILGVIFLISHKNLIQLISSCFVLFALISLFYVGLKKDPSGTSEIDEE